jgi:acetyl-CoA C-acetyltransferase
MAGQSTSASALPREVVVLAAVRTAIGKYGGGLRDVPPADLAAKVTREAITRSGVDASDIGHVVFGHVIHTEARDMYLARAAAINAGLPVETPALTLNRLCGSGLQAIISAAQTIALGEADVAVAGGAESMSRAQYWLPGLRWASGWAMAAPSTR